MIPHEQATDINVGHFRTSVSVPHFGDFDQTIYSVFVSTCLRCADFYHRYPLYVRFCRPLVYNLLFHYPFPIVADI